MKKLAIFFFILIIIIAGISYMYLNYQSNYYEAKRENWQFENYQGKEVLGSELTTIINKAVDNNENNEVSKNAKGAYINNDKNSIQIDIKMLDVDKTYTMETFYNGGMEKFVQYYSEIKFKCTRNRISFSHQ